MSCDSRRSSCSLARTRRLVSPLLPPLDEAAVAGDCSSSCLSKRSTSPCSSKIRRRACACSSDRSAGAAIAPPAGAVLDPAARVVRLLARAAVTQRAAPSAATAAPACVCTPGRGSGFAVRGRATARGWLSMGACGPELSLPRPRRQPG
eukprot:scaffold1670_cov370-Prasinococcus_capsulatus_cf.AAC.9